MAPKAVSCTDPTIKKYVQREIRKWRNLAKNQCKLKKKYRRHLRGRIKTRDNSINLLFRVWTGISKYEGLVQKLKGGDGKIGRKALRGLHRVRKKTQKNVEMMQGMIEQARETLEYFEGEGKERIEMAERLYGVRLLKKTKKE